MLADKEKKTYCSLSANSIKSNVNEFRVVNLLIFCSLLYGDMKLIFVHRGHGNVDTVIGFRVFHVLFSLRCSLVHTGFSFFRFLYPEIAKLAVYLHCCLKTFFAIPSRISSKHACFS